QIEETTSDYDREKLQERLAKLAGGVAGIKGGGATGTAVEGEKARGGGAADAAPGGGGGGTGPGGGGALPRGAEGGGPGTGGGGGGVALRRASKAVDGVKAEGDEKVGALIVQRALEAPIRQIVENAGAEGSVIVEKVKSEPVANRGYDAESMEYVDMVQAGI